MRDLVVPEDRVERPAGSASRARQSRMHTELIRGMGDSAHSRYSSARKMVCDPSSGILL